MYMLFRYAAAKKKKKKKKNCDLDGRWQNTSVFHQPFYLISFGLLRESPKRYELGRDSSVKKERVTLLLSCIQVMHLLIIYQELGLNHL